MTHILEDGIDATNHFSPFFEKCRVSNADWSTLNVISVDPDRKQIIHAQNDFFEYAGPNNYVTNFASNQYLALEKDSRQIEEVIKSAKKWGVGVRGSALQSGLSSVHIELQHCVAAAYDMDRTILFGSLSLANFLSISAFMSDGDFILIDEHCHFSAIQGCTIPGIILKFFKHNDMDDLERLLKDIRHGTSDGFNKILIYTDGIFMMDGDLSPLGHISKIAKKFNCLTMVDDAHAFGWFGLSGKGSLEHWKLKGGDIDIVVGTFGKALCAAGGFLCTNDFLWNKIYYSECALSAGMPDMIAAISLNAVKIAFNSVHSPALHLKKIIKRWQDGIENLGLHFVRSDTVICAIFVPKADIFNFWRKLYKVGIYTMHFGHPIVPEGSEMLRTTLTANLSFSEIDQALKKIRDIVDYNFPHLITKDRKIRIERKSLINNLATRRVSTFVANSNLLSWARKSLSANSKIGTSMDISMLGTIKEESTSSSESVRNAMFMTKELSIKDRTSAEGTTLENENVSKIEINEVSETKENDFCP